MLPGRTNAAATAAAAAAAAHERFIFRLTNFASTCGRIFKRASRTTPCCAVVGVSRCLFVTW